MEWTESARIFHYAGSKADVNLVRDVVDFIDTQRKPLEGVKRASGAYPYYGTSGIIDYVDWYLFDEKLVLLSDERYHTERLENAFEDIDRVIAEKMRS